MLDWILMVTIGTGNLADTESAYHDDLGYEVVERGQVESALAHGWGAPAVAGNRYLLMRPASGMPVYLRFIETDTADDTMPHATEGWNAAEMLVEDTDELARRLATSKHFRIVGPPAFLTPEQSIRALQVTGPNNEMLYLTKVVRPESVDLDIGTAASFVDRVFIVVAGARDLGALMNFYRDRLKLPVTEPVPYRIAVLSRAYGLPEDRMHRLSLAVMRNQFFLELDEYPAAARPRNSPPGMLPGGIAMVTFEVESLDAVAVPFVSPPALYNPAPYDGRRSATVKGAAGELIELVESRPRRDVAAYAEPR